MTKSVWTSLEITKIIVSILTPLVIFILGIIVNNNIEKNQQVLRELEEQKKLELKNKEALKNITASIYARITRGELLTSALTRNLSEEEITKRKTEYDETFFEWNRDHQINLLLIRNILAKNEYSNFEKMIQSRLVQEIFTPLDRCLTEAYDYRIQTKKSSSAILKRCDASALRLRSINCGYALTNNLFEIIQATDSQATEKAEAIVKKAC